MSSFMIARHFLTEKEGMLTPQILSIVLTGLLTPENASPFLVFNYVNIQHDQYMYTALNDTTLEIHLRNPFPPFLGLLTTMYGSVVPHEAVSTMEIISVKIRLETGPFSLPDVERRSEGLF